MPDTLDKVVETGTIDAELKRLIQRAITEQWDIDPSWKATLPRVALSIIGDKTKPDKARLRALQLVIQMDRANAQDLATAARLSVDKESNAIAREAAAGDKLATLIATDPNALAAAIKLGDMLTGQPATPAANESPADPV